MEIAIPANDIMLDVSFIPNMGINDKITATGIVIMGIKADGKCQRKNRITKLTIIISSVS